MSLSRPVRVFWLIASLSLITDQVTKAVVRVLWDSALVSYPFDQLVGRLVRPTYALGESIPVIGDAVQFSFVRNEGAAFGMLPGQRPLFVAVVLVVLVVVAGYWRRERPDRRSVVIALGLVSAGAVGNLIDRVLFGKVTDFIDFAVIEFPVFNIADSSIFIGVGILILHLLFSPAPPLEDAQVDTASNDATETDTAPADNAPEVS